MRKHLATILMGAQIGLLLGIAGLSAAVKPVAADTCTITDGANRFPLPCNCSDPHYEPAVGLWEADCNAPGYPFLVCTSESSGQGPWDCVPAPEPPGEYAYIQGGDFVGQLWVWGDNTGYDTTGTLAVQASGNEQFNDPSLAHAQSVNSTFAKAYRSNLPSGAQACGTNRGCFKVYTAPRSDNGWGLGAGTYDVLVVNHGYVNHTTAYDSPKSGTKVGAVAIGTGGKITSATDASGNAVAVINNIAGGFQLPTSYTASVGTEEAAVWIHGPGCYNGNEAPLTIV